MFVKPASSSGEEANRFAGQALDIEVAESRVDRIISELPLTETGQQGSMKARVNPSGLGELLSKS